MCPDMRKLIKENERLKKLHSRDFVCYGCKKTIKQLNRYEYKRNRKKVRRSYERITFSIIRINKESR
jgi:hypothetical protein